MPVPKISVCIPVFRTEKWLAECLQSIASQNFKEIEVLVLSDASDGRDENGLTAKKIVKKFQKCVDFPVHFLENSRTLCLIEVRRRLVEEAEGEYIFMLDSDDALAQNALSFLYEAAVKNDADIVQGNCVTMDSELKNHVESRNEFQAFQGILEGRKVFEECFINGKYRPVIASKLIRKTVYQKAFSQIPFIYAHMAEEVLQYFFIARFSEKYAGIDEPVYLYRQGTGITGRKIKNLEEWQKVCSASGIITALYDWAETETQNGNPPSEEEMKSLQRLAKFYCLNNVKQLQKRVSEYIKKEARDMLCEYWGKDAIERTEEFLLK
ncbi:glycosyltransferase family 2 protein [Treponema sp.]|uniref:glycosyltransferase family 2 protein n=1 Tax=Treponema sp. TaxID=166 RepID=UPI0038911287